MIKDKHCSSSQTKHKFKSKWLTDLIEKAEVIKIFTRKHDKIFLRRLSYLEKWK